MKSSDEITTDVSVNDNSLKMCMLQVIVAEQREWKEKTLSLLTRTNFSISIQINFSFENVNFIFSCVM